MSHRYDGCTLTIEEARNEFIEELRSKAIELLGVLYDTTQNDTDTEEEMNNATVKDEKE